MNARALADALKRFWVVLVVAALLGASAGAGYSATTKRTYEATSEMLFSIAAASSAMELNQASTYLERAMTSYSAMTTTPYVLDPVIAQLKLDTDARTLANSITATVPTSTVLLDITVEADTPEAAELTANAVADRMVKVVDTTAPKAANQPALKATVISRAVRPGAASGLGLPVLLVLGVLGGLAVGSLAVWALMARDRRVRHPQDLGVEPVGLLRAYRSGGPSTQGWKLSADPASLGEDFRGLRESLEGVWRDIPMAEGPRVLLVTSPSHHADDRTDVSVGLAQAFAETGSRVTLVDGDLRSQTLTALLGTAGQPGFTDVVKGTSSTRSVSRDTRLPGVRLLGAGTGVSNVGEALSSGSLDGLVDPESDVVIIDAPQCSNVSDATILSSVATDCLMVVPMGTVSADELAAVLDRWSAVARPPSMVVATKVAPADIL